MDQMPMTALLLGDDESLIEIEGSIINIYFWIDAVLDYNPDN